MMISNSSVTIMHDDATIALENLYPALLQCFVIITCGYVAGRQNLISNTEAKGLGTFVGTFSLPALIFMSLAEVDLHSVNWMFLLSVFVAKTIVFLTVIVITLFISRPVHPGRAGLFAIFCTQSNDFAVGCPIVEALYGNVHPEYITYLYLMAPISLGILNPLAFVLMETGKQREIASTTLEDPSPRPTLQMVITVTRNVVLNPVVLMTLLGTAGNLVFSHHVPAVISGLLKVLGSAFSATALFLLGHRMVGKVHILQGRVLVVPGILIAVKLLVLPIVTREVISLLHPGANTSVTVDLSTYGFLYGTFPAAPGVFVFATQYSLDVDLIAAAMVACTFISAPFIFVSAKMITVTKLKPSDYLVELDYFAFDVSIVGILASVWMLFSFLCNKKYRRFPHSVTFCLLISQLIGCVGILLWSKLDLTRGWTCYVQFAVFTFGVHSSRLWTALLAVVLLFLQCRSLCFVLKLQPYLVIVGWGLPVVAATTMMCLQTERIEKQKTNMNFQFSETDTAVSLFLLIFCFVVTIGSLILHQRYNIRYARYVLLLDNTVADDHGDMDSDAGSRISDSNFSSNDVCATGCDRRRVIDIEELTEEERSNLCPEQFSCTNHVRGVCYERVGRYHEQAEESEEGEENQQVLQHQILLLLLASSMFVGIAFSIWTLIMEEMSGIYIELAFLDTSLNFGQSIFVLAVFGLDTKTILLPIVTRWRTFWYKTPMVQLPDSNELSFETRHVCDQFVLHHLENCKSEIARDKRWRFQTYEKVFTGSVLVDWLIQSGLARDRTEASEYATLLVNGRVLRHVERLHHFHDRHLLYTFEY